MESVLGEVQADRINERPSSGGQYVSVKIGPVVIMNPDQVRTEQKVVFVLRWRSFTVLGANVAPFPCLVQGVEYT